jgi:hypothetical protein
MHVMIAVVNVAFNIQSHMFYDARAATTEPVLMS